MTPEETAFLILICVGAVAVLTLTALAMVTAGYAIKGLINGNGIRHELQPIFQDIKAT